MNSYMNDHCFSTYEHFHFVIKTSIAFKILFIYLHIYFLTTNFSRCCGWLRFAAQPKLLIFTLGIQTFVLPYNNNNTNNNYKYPNLLLIKKLTVKSYLQLISLKKLFSQRTIYIPFD